MVSARDRRPIAYRALSLALQWPGKGWIATLDQALADLEGADAHPLKRSLEELANLPLEQVQGAYTGLFINGFPHTPCPPYESAYCGLEGLLGPAAEQVSVFYRQWGLSCDAQLPDHIAVELELMYLLQSGAAAAQGRERTELESAAKAFWRTHVGRWIDAFAQDVSANAPLPFYRVLASFLSAFSRAEHAQWGKPQDLSTSISSREISIKDENETQIHRRNACVSCSCPY